MSPSSTTGAGDRARLRAVRKVLAGESLHDLLPADTDVVSAPGRMVDEALGAAWSTLAVLAPGNVTPWCSRRERWPRLLAAGRAAWPDADALGPRATAGSLHGAPYGTFRTGVHYILANLGVKDVMGAPLTTERLERLCAGLPVGT